MEVLRDFTKVKTKDSLNAYISKRANFVKTKRISWFVTNLSAG